MALQKIVSKETAAKVGRVLGAQVLVRGSVTEFDQKAGGTGLRLGVASGMFGGALGGQSTQGVVGIDVRLIDTTTGQVIQSHRSEAKVSASGLSADVMVKQFSFGGEQFQKTVLGQATREAIEKSVGFIIEAMEPVQWTGSVVQVDGDQVYINAGSNSGVRGGDIFVVSKVVRELTDPSSGELLGIDEMRLGEVEVAKVEEKFSIARMRTPFTADRGDLVKYAGE